MNKGKISGIITFVAAIFMVGAVKVWAPVCQKTLELANGGETHMKCFYYGQVVLYIGALLFVEAIVLFLAKNARAIGVIVIVTGVLMILMTSGTVGIGVCPNPEMMCNSTALWGRIGAVVAIVGGIFAMIGEGSKIPQVK